MVKKFITARMTYLECRGDITHDGTVLTLSNLDKILFGLDMLKNSDNKEFDKDTNKLIKKIERIKVRRSVGFYTIV